MSSILEVDLTEPEAPVDVVRRLKQIDEDFDLRLTSRKTLDYSNVNNQRWWSLVLKWRSNDPRHALVEKGDLGNARFDVITMLPMDCSVETAFDFLVRGLKSRTGESTQNLLSRIHHWNDEAVKKNLQPVEELSQELIETNAKTLFKEEGKAVPQVFQYQGKKK